MYLEWNLCIILIQKRDSMSSSTTSIHSSISFSSSLPESFYNQKELLFEKLIALGILDAQGCLTEKGKQIPLPSLENLTVQQHQRLEELLTKPITVGTKTIVLKDLLKEIALKHPNLSIQIVGGALPYILGPEFYREYFSNLGITLSEDLLLELLEKPKDLDIRIYLDCLDEKTAIDLQDFLTIYFGSNRKIKPSYKNEESNQSLYLKYGNPADLSIDLLIVGNLSRHTLFTRDLMLDVTSLITDAPKIDLNIEEEKEIAVIHRILKCIDAKNPETINQYGWGRSISLISQEHRCIRKGLEDLLITNLQDLSTYSIVQKIQTTWKKHHDQDTNARIVLFFNGCLSLIQKLPSSDIEDIWKQTPSNTIENKNSLFKALSKALETRKFSFSIVHAYLQVAAFLTLGTLSTVIKSHHGKMCLQLTISEENRKYSFLMPFSINESLTFIASHERSEELIELVNVILALSKNKIFSEHILQLDEEPLIKLWNFLNEGSCFPVAEISWKILEQFCLLSKDNKSKMTISYLHDSLMTLLRTYPDYLPKPSISLWIARQFSQIIEEESIRTFEYLYSYSNVKEQVTEKLVRNIPDGMWFLQRLIPFDKPKAKKFFETLFTVKKGDFKPEEINQCAKLCQVISEEDIEWEAKYVLRLLRKGANETSFIKRAIALLQHFFRENNPTQCAQQILEEVHNKKMDKSSKEKINKLLPHRTQSKVQVAINRIDEESSLSLCLEKFNAIIKEFPSEVELISMCAWTLAERCTKERFDDTVDFLTINKNQKYFRKDLYKKSKLLVDYVTETKKDLALSTVLNKNFPQDFSLEDRARLVIYVTARLNDETKINSELNKAIIHHASFFSERVSLEFLRGIRIHSLDFPMSSETIVFSITLFTKFITSDKSSVDQKENAIIDLDWFLKKYSCAGQEKALFSFYAYIIENEQTNDQIIVWIQKAIPFLNREHNTLAFSDTLLNWAEKLIEEKRWEECYSVASYIFNDPENIKRLAKIWRRLSIEFREINPEKSLQIVYEEYRFFSKISIIKDHVIIILKNLLNDPSLCDYQNLKIALKVLELYQIGNVDICIKLIKTIIHHEKNLIESCLGFINAENVEWISDDDKALLYISCIKELSEIKSLLILKLGDFQKRQFKGTLEEYSLGSYYYLMGLVLHLEHPVNVNLLPKLHHYRNSINDTTILELGYEKFVAVDFFLAEAFTQLPTYLLYRVNVPGMTYIDTSNFIELFPFGCKLLKNIFLNPEKYLNFEDYLSHVFKVLSALELKENKYEDTWNVLDLKENNLWALRRLTTEIIRDGTEISEKAWELVHKGMKKSINKIHSVATWCVFANILNEFAKCLPPENEKVNQIKSELMSVFGNFCKYYCQRESYWSEIEYVLVDGPIIQKRDLMNVLYEKGIINYFNYYFLTQNWLLRLCGIAKSPPE